MWLIKNAVLLVWTGLQLSVNWLVSVVTTLWAYFYHYLLPWVVYLLYIAIIALAIAIIGFAIYALGEKMIAVIKQRQRMVSRSARYKKCK